MELEKVLDFIFSRTDAVRVLWNLFILVSLGTLGFVAKAEPGDAKRRLSKLVALGFAVFALSNLLALFQTQAEREGFVEIARGLGLDEYAHLDRALWFVPQWLLVVFHSAMDVGIITAILWLGRKDDDASAAA